MSWLHRYSLLVAGCTLLLIVAGALVTSNDAGLAVPDWPLSYGTWLPEMEGGILYQHGHRMIAAAVGLLTLILALWIHVTDTRYWMRKVGWSACALMIAQALWGGATVLFLLPKWASIVHALLAHSFFSMVCAIRLMTSESFMRAVESEPDGAWPPLRTVGVVATSMMFIQLSLGAAVRHGLMGVLPHMGGAMLSMAVVVWYIVRILVQYGEHRPLRKLAIALLVLMFVQVLAGLVAYVGRAANAGAPQPLPFMVASTVVHVGLGAVTVAVCVLNTVQVFRSVRGSRDAELAPGMTVVS
jgi:cytochrome c oxidase assembly protein subunit 15